jgi:copper resistance protein B
MSTHPLHPARLHALALGLTLALTATPAVAQSSGTTSPPAVDPHAGHVMPPAAAPKKKKPAAATPAPAPAKKTTAPVDPHAGHNMAAPAPAPAKKKPTPAAPAPAAAPAKKKLAVVDPHAGHTMAPTAPAPAKKRPVSVAPAPAPAKKKPVPVDPHAGHNMATPVPAPTKKNAAVVDPHAGHTMAPPAAAPAAKKPVAVDPHAGHTMAPATAPASKPAQPVADPHAGHAPAATTPAATPMDHAAMGHEMPLPDNAPRTPIPALTDADRAAAFPAVSGHAAHDKRPHSYWELDRLEAWDADPGTGVGWKGTAWIGGDINRVWLRSEGEQVGGDLESADLELLGGHSVSRWWDVVAGVRHEIGEGPSQTFAAVGVQGLTPYKFDMEATAYLGSGGQTAVRIEAEYDTLLTNRWVLQWHGELEAYGQDDPRRGRGAGLSTVEAGVRLRFEVTRKFAPYIGLVHERSFGDTADYRRDSGEPTDDTRVVAGVRVWF